MGVLNRFADVVNSNVNALLDSAEKPEHMLRLLIQDMEEALGEARSHAAELIAEQKRLNRNKDTSEKQMKDWHVKAEFALKKGREDLAREALLQVEKLKSDVVIIEQQLAQISDALNGIESDTGALNEKLNEARSKIRITEQRLNTFNVSRRTKLAIDSEKIEAITNKYDNLQRKVEALESEVEAYDMTSQGLNYEFKKLETEAVIDEKLAELKKKIAKG